jgi:hypothetical protein
MGGVAHARWLSHLVWKEGADLRLWSRHRFGWRVTARCAFGNRDGMKSIRVCIYRAPLDMQTLVWTRGPNFPLSRLESRLMCARARLTPRIASVRRAEGAGRSPC